MIRLFTILVTISTVCYAAYYKDECITTLSRYGTVTGGGTMPGCDKEVYKINFSRQVLVRMKWNSLEVEDGELPYCLDARVEVLKNCRSDPLFADNVGEFCTKNMVSSVPHDVYANTDCIYLVVKHKDKYNQKSKFSVTFETGASPPRCERYTRKTYSSSRGVLSSPSWPGYSSYDKCDSWKLQAGSNEKIHLQIMDIKHKSVHYCYESDSHLTVKGSGRYDTETRYCANKEMGLDSPVSMSYVPAEYESNDEGFVIGWVAYKVEGDNSDSASATIVIVVVLLIVVIVISVAAGLWRRKRQQGFFFRAQNRGPNVPLNSNPTQTTYPPYQSSYPPQQSGNAQQQSGYPPQQAGYPTKQSGYPPQQAGYPPQQSGYPPQQFGYPPQQSGYPPQQAGYPPQQAGYPPQQTGYPPQQPGYLPQANNGSYQIPEMPPPAYPGPPVGAPVDAAARQPYPTKE